tara:strand:+ start:756 stop:1652 length:897 start_codon:yes stop_codon:yes gene_type:complete
MERTLQALGGWLRKAGLNSARAHVGAQELFWPAREAGLSGRDIAAVSSAFQHSPLETRNGNLWSHLEDHMADWPNAQSAHQFLRATTHLAPHWLSKATYARSGKYELFYRLTRPGCGWARKGDVLDQGKVVEIKGAGGRLLHPELTGACHHALSARSIGRHGFVANKVRGRETDRSFEIVKASQRAFYSRQFAERPDDARRALAAYLETLQIVPRYLGPEAAHLALGGRLPFDQILRDLWLCAVYRRLREEGDFDRLIIYGDGTNVKIVDQAPDLDLLTVRTVGIRTGHPERISVRLD